MTKHFLKAGQRQTACGRKAKRTASDTEKPGKVTCKTCKRVIASWRKACAQLGG